MYPILRQELKKNDVKWYLIWADGADRDENILNSLREAMKVYAYSGYRGVTKIYNINTKCTVYVMF